MKEIKLSTDVNVVPSEWKIDHHSKIMTIGSCFADVLGSQLKSYKFDVLNNPLGTVFNPLAISKIIDLALTDKAPNAALYLQNPDHIWLHHDFHSSQWSLDKTDLETRLADKLKEMKRFLSEANVLVITLGTAYAYRHRQTNQIIGNCHKLPAEKFLKELLHPDQMGIAWEHLIQKLQTFKRDLRIIVTVSPVRHTRDTLPLNQVSKATLRLLCHRLCEKYKQVEYFPSYEIMIDELRDYRFYEEDLIHPNQIAEDYIFNVFAHAFLDPHALTFMKDWDSVQQTMNHRPLHGFTKSHLKLLKSLWSKLNAISRNVDVAPELEEIERRIREFPAQ